MCKIEYEDLIVFHPGYYIEDYLVEENISYDELAKLLQVSNETVNDLVNGKILLTADMAIRISKVFGTSSSLWLNLNQKYIEKIKYIPISDDYSAWLYF